MGLKSNFNKFLRDKCPEIFELIHISEYSYKKVAIDISLYLHKFKAVCGDRWITAFINLIASLRRNEIHCVFIYDGKAPPEKDKERAKRREDKEKLEKSVYDLEEALDEYHKTGTISTILSNLFEKRQSPPRLLGKKTGIDMKWIEEKIKQKRNQIIDIVPSDFELTKTLFRILKVPFFTAPHEAEKMCSKLCIDGIVDAVLSEDTDVMAYNAPVFLTKIDTVADTWVQIRSEFVLKSLELDQFKFLDFCIMCGTDYNPNIPKVGSVTAYKKILEFGSIDNITKLDISVLNHKRVRQLFTEFENYGISSIPYCGQPDFEKLQEFINTHNIQINIEKLRRDFIREIIIIEDPEIEEPEIDLETA